MNRIAEVASRLRLAAVLVAAAASTASAATYQVPLNYNFNGIVHPGEAGQADNPDGYRSIADRGIDYTGLSGSLVAPYNIVSQAGVLDIVHLGNRNTVGNGFRPFDPAPDGDGEGIVPNWLPNVDQTGPQTTLLPVPVQLNALAQARVLFQVSNGGGSMDVRFGFASGPDVVAALNAPDWFIFDNNNMFGAPNGFKGTENTDAASPSPAFVGLNLTSGTINLAAQAGRTVTSITFENRSNTSGGYGIFAANLLNVTVIPEPSSLILSAIGAIGAFGWLRRRR